MTAPREPAGVPPPAGGTALAPLDAPVPPPSDEKTSVLLRRILDELPEDEVLVGQLVRALRRRSFGGILILLALLGMVPGVSALAGLVMLVPGLQMLAGLRAPVLPRVIRRRAVPSARLRQLGDRALPWFERIERIVRPRWLRATTAPFPNLVGLVVVALALVVMLPLPFSNFPPALALVCLSLGLLERDGLVICVGLALSALAIAVGVLIAAVAAKSLALLM